MDHGSRQNTQEAYCSSIWSRKKKDEKSSAKKRKSIQNAIAFQDGLCYSGIKLGQSIMTDNLDKEDPSAELLIARNMCPELEKLHATLNGHVFF